MASMEKDGIYGTHATGTICPGDGIYGTHPTGTSVVEMASTEKVGIYGTHTKGTTCPSDGIYGERWHLWDSHYGYHLSR
jgi:hypothetical protein